LYPALHRAGFANQASAESRSDGLVLKDMYITAAARCAPPENKPRPEELNNCQPFLEREIQILKPKVIVCLGRIAFERVLKVFSASLTTALFQNGREGKWKFGHGALYQLENNVWVLGSYHPSQQNTLTGKLTVKMFDDIWRKAKELIEAE
jgi:uracil-DNA glycosylase family 4